MHANTRAHQHTHTHHKTRQDKTRQDKTRQDKTRQDRTGQDRTGQDKTRQREKREEKREERDIFTYTCKCVSFQGSVTHVSVHTLTFHDAHYPSLRCHPPPSSPSSNPKTIQYLIPGWATIVKLLKQVKIWQSPSQDPWSNCLINSQKDHKGQSYYYSGRQKDNSKTICGRAG